MHKLPAHKTQFITVNYIRLHYVDYYQADAPTLIMMHGLTANARAFDALVARLHPNYRIICPDFRGNGQSDAPTNAYSLKEHAQDIVAIINHLDLQQVYLAGHSFGGYMAFFIAANYPELVSKLVILDAAKAMNPRTPQMLSGAMSRLDVVYPDFDAYVAHVRNAPYLTIWDPMMIHYFRADVQDLPEGGVKPHSKLKNMTAKSMGLMRSDWNDMIESIRQPTLLVNALENYTMGEQLLPTKIARETVAMMQNATYRGVSGNHQTMLYGEGAKETAAFMIKFLNE